MRTTSPTPAAFVITLLVALAALLPARRARADDDDELVNTTRNSMSHSGQFGVHLQLGTGYRVLFPYNKEYCGQAGSAGEPKSVCTGRSPAFLDAGLSYGVSQALEVLAEVRLGIEHDFSGLSGTEGPRPLSLAAGLRLFVDADGKLKFFSTVEGIVELTDYSGTTLGGNGVALDNAADFGVRNVNGVQFDFHRTFGLYAHFGETTTFANWLRFELHGGVGVQARFP
jgi:hypothetical protein